MWVASEPCSGSVRPKVIRSLEGQRALDEFVFLGLRAEVAQHHDERKVADHRMLVLQVVEQAQALGGEMVADDRHPQVVAVLPAEFAWAAKPEEAGLVGRLLGLDQQASHSGRGRPPLSKSVRAHSRRWSKKRSLSSCACSGLISASMKASIRAR
jgi:hypothetical protein